MISHSQVCTGTLSCSVASIFSMNLDTIFSFGEAQPRGFTGLCLLLLSSCGDLQKRFKLPVGKFKHHGRPREEWSVKCGLLLKGFQRSSTPGNTSTKCRDEFSLPTTLKTGTNLAIRSGMDWEQDLMASQIAIQYLGSRVPTYEHTKGKVSLAIWEYNLDMRPGEWKSLVHMPSKDESWSRDVHK